MVGNILRTKPSAELLQSVRLEVLQSISWTATEHQQNCYKADYLQHGFAIPSRSMSVSQHRFWSALLQSRLQRLCADDFECVHVASCVTRGWMFWCSYTTLLARTVPVLLDTCVRDLVILWQLALAKRSHAVPAWSQWWSLCSASPLRVAVRLAVLTPILERIF